HVDVDVLDVIGACDHLLRRLRCDYRPDVQVGPVVGDDPISESQYSAVLSDGNLNVMDLSPPVICGHEILHSLLGPLDGPPQSESSYANGELVGVNLQLTAKAATHVRSHDSDSVLRKAEVFAVPRAYVVWPLSPDPDRQHLAPPVVARDYPPSLKWNRGHPWDAKRLPQ